MSGQVIGGVVGAVVGSFIPGVGTQVGWMIGSAIGGYVDPTQVFGPRLQDVRGQTSAVGGAIPRGWGTFPAPCNVIWQQPGVTEHENTSSGKGSGTEQVTYTYTRSYALMFHLGEIAGVLQIKRNGKIVFDARDDATLEEEYTRFGMTTANALARITGQRAENAKFMDRCVIYTGTQTQNPDPTIEAYEGVGNVPSYRGRAYMVVTDDETQAGEIAQYEVVVAACGTVNTVTGWAEHPVNWMIQSNDAGRLYVANDPTSWTVSYLHTITHRYVTAYGNSIIMSSPTTGAINASYSDDYGVTISTLTGWPTQNIAPPLVLPSGRVVLLKGHATAAEVFYNDDPFDAGGWTTVSLGMGASYIAGDDDCIIVTSATERKVSTNRGVSFGSALSNGGPIVTSIGHKDGLFVFGTGSMPIWSSDRGATLTTATGSTHSGQSISMFPMPDGSWISAGRRLSPSTTDNIARSADGKTGWATVTTPSMYFESSEGQRIAERGGVVLACGNVGGLLSIIQSLDYGVTWSSVAHGYSGFTVHDGIGIAAFPILPDQAIAMPDAPGYYTQPDGTIIYPDYETLTPCSTTTVGQIVADMCELSGLTSDEYDVSQLTDVLDGYVVARETDAASVIESLRPIGMFDPAEWDGKFRGIKRGGTAVGSINADDLVERDGDAFEREMVQEAELLRRVTIGYLDPATNWAPNTQKWERLVGTIQARGESTSEVPAVLPADTAATVCKRKGLTAWGEPEKQKFSLPYRLAKYTPTDILNYTDADAEVHSLRIMQAEDDSGIRYMESSLNCAEAYDATATGVTAKPPAITDPFIYGPTILRAMNLDSRRAQDNVPGMYLAACGVQAGWGGCVVELSTDGGVSFRTIGTITSPATIGYLSNGIGTSGEPVQVKLYAGSGPLSSATTAQVADGANACAIVTAGVAELIQFETATATAATAYDLTDVTRGVDDTTAAIHNYGDAFVLLDGDVMFVPIDVAFAGLTLIFRAVTIGTSSDAATNVSVNYEPPTFVLDGGGA